MDKPLESGDLPSIINKKKLTTELFTFRSAQKLIEDGNAGVVLAHLDDYPEIDRPFIVSKIISRGEPTDVLKYIASIPPEHHQILAKAVLSAGAERELVDFLGVLKDLDENIAVTLLGTGKYYKHIIVNIESFKNECRSNIINKIIDHGHEALVRARLDKLKGLDTTVAQKILSIGKDKTKEESLRLVALNLESFRNLNPEIAAELIEGGYIDLVFGSPESFIGFGSSLAKRLIDQKLARFVALNLDKFTGLDSSIALGLVNEGYADRVMEKAEIFGPLSQIVAEAIVEKDLVENVNIVLNNIGNFVSLDYNALANKVIDAGEEFILIDRISEFLDLGSGVALKLIEKGWGSSVRTHFEKFKNLTPAVFEALLRVSKNRSEDIELISANLNSFMLISVSMAEEIVQNGDFSVLEKNKEKILIVDPSLLFQLLEKIKIRFGVEKSDFLEKIINENIIRFRQLLDNIEDLRINRRDQEIKFIGDFNKNGIVAVGRFIKNDSYFGSVVFVDAFCNKKTSTFDGLLRLNNGVFIASKNYSERYILNENGEKISGPFFHVEILSDNLITTFEYRYKTKINEPVIKKVYICDYFGKRLSRDFFDVTKTKDGKIIVLTTAFGGKINELFHREVQVRKEKDGTLFYF